MGTIESPDGVRIGYEQSGAGRPLILVHGVGGTAARWAPVMPAIAQHARVYAIDRRGRGASGDAPAYALEREVEDIMALADTLGEPVDLLGHSYGAVCALEAATHMPNLRRLILYEPPLANEDVALYPEGVIDRLEALLTAGDREGMLTAFFREIVRMPDDAIRLFRSSPAWPARIAAAHTVPRELRAHAAYNFDAARFRTLTTPTLLLLGGASPPVFRVSIERIAAVLPASRTVVLAGQQHVAMDTAPELFVREVLAFLRDHELSAG